MATGTGRNEFAPPPTPGSVRALILAIAAHAVLVAMLTVGVQWKQTAAPVTVEAELWSALPVQAAPPVPEPVPEPDPIASPEPTPTPTPVAVPEVPTPRPQAAPPVPNVDADIAIAKAKEKELAQQKAQEKERLRQEALERAQEKLDQEKIAKQKQDKLQQDKLQQEKLKQAKLEQDKLQQEKLQQDKLKKDKLEQEKLARDKDTKASDAAKQKAALKVKQEEKLLEELRQQNLKRMAGLAGSNPGAASGNGNAGSQGTAAQSSGPSAGYGGRIRARIKPNITYTESITGNPTAEVEVRTSPDGTIISRKLTQGSGIKSWDDAVLNAIDKTEVLPRDVDGWVPSSLVISFRPKD